MKLIRNIKDNHIAILLITGFVFTGLITGLWFIPKKISAKNIWKGYYSILIKNEQEQFTPEKILKTDDSTSYLSIENAEVDFFDYSGISSVAVKDLPERFDPLDPRYDPYMRALPGLFKAEWDNESARLIFIPENMKIGPLKNHLETLFSGASFSWCLADSAPFPVFTGVTAILTFSFLLVFSKGSIRRKTSFFGTLPWILVFGRGGSESLIASVFLLWGWVLADRALWKYYSYVFIQGKNDKYALKLGKNMVIPVWFLAGGIFILFFCGGWFPVLLALTADICLSTGSLLRLKRKREGSAHPLFFPVPISEKPLKKKKVPRLNGILLAALAVGMPFLVSASGGRTGLIVPAPSEYAGKSFSMRNIRGLYESSKGEIPDMGDYIAHRSFQEGYMYGRTYAFPDTDKSGGYSDFTEHDGAITRELVIPKEFTDQWYKDIMANCGETSIPGLLYTQGSPVYVYRTSIEDISVQSIVLWQYLVIIGVMFLPLLLLQIIPVPQVLYVVFRSNVLRRKTR